MATISKHLQGLRRGRKPAGRKPGTRGKCKPRPPRDCADDFLKYQFDPVFPNDSPLLKGYRRTQQHLLRSAKNLAQLHGLTVPNVSQIAYPLDIAYLAENLSQQCSNKLAYTTVEIIQEDERPPAFCTVTVLETSPYIFYIQVKDLLAVLRTPGNPLRSLLFTNLLKFCYHQMKIPFYMHRCSYVGGAYDSVLDWLLSEGIEPKEDPERWEYFKEVDACYRRAARNGRKIERYLRKPIKPGWENAVRRFKPENEIDKLLKKISQEFIRHYKKYPNRHLFTEIPDCILEPDNEQRTYKDFYLSFCYSWWDALGEELNSYVENDMQEHTVRDEPFVVQSFAEPQTEINMDTTYFEEAFYLIDQLICFIRKI